jgi:hypothetical protein
MIVFQSALMGTAGKMASEGKDFPLQQVLQKVVVTFKEVYGLAITSSNDWGEKNFAAYEKLLNNLKSRLPKGDGRIAFIDEKISRINNVGPAAEAPIPPSPVYFDSNKKIFTLTLQPPLSEGYVPAIQVQFRFNKSNEIAIVK